MLFNQCESCSNIGTCACGCESSPRYFCDSHVSNHIASGGKHSIEPALETLTASEVSIIEEAYTNYYLSSLHKAVQIKNTQIEHLLRQIRKAEEECSYIIKNILSGPITKDVRQVVSYKALPLFSDSSVICSLVELKHTSYLSGSKIWDLLNSLNSSLLSSISSSFSSPRSSTHTSPPSIASVQTSSKPSLSAQTFPSQIDILTTVRPTNYRWELLQQTQAHKDWIYSIAVSECETYVATASQDKTIKIFELQTLRPLRTLQGHAHWVTSVSFLGNKILSGSEDTTIKIWEEDRCENTLNLHSDVVRSVCVSSCKRMIASGSFDKTAVVFRLEDNKPLHTLTHPDGVHSVAFSRNDKEIVSGSGYSSVFGGRGEIRIWDTETGELLNTLSAHSRTVNCVKYSGKLIASSSKDKNVKVWDRDNSLPLFAFSDHSGGVASVDISDNVVASLGMDDKITIRDTRSGTVLQTLQAHGNYPKIIIIVPMGLKVLEEGKLIVSGGGDGVVKVWRRDY